MHAHWWPGLWEFIEGGLPATPARVLDVGCGDGRSTRWLQELGFEPVGLDPRAPAGDPFVRSTLERYRAGAPHDAALAVRSLHHLDDLGEAMEALELVLHPGARLIVFEFDVAAVDGRAEEWVARRGLERPVGEAEIAHLIPVSELREGLRHGFRELRAEPCGYLAREGGRPDLEGEENDAIAAGEIDPAGWRLILERREA
jgi:SAM-dependent methyltransferase